MLRRLSLLAIGVWTILATTQAAATGVTISDQSFVLIGTDAIAQQETNPNLVMPTILMEVQSDKSPLAQIETAILNPHIVHENKLIEQNQAMLANVELLAHQLGAPVFSDIAAERSDFEVAHIEHSLMEKPSHDHVEFLSGDEHLPEATSLLEAAPVTTLPTLSAEEADVAAMEREVNMVELAAEVTLPKKTLSPKNDYAFMDDPKSGGQPTVLKNLKGLDIYVVNTPVADNENEIRPVKPPRPMSAAMRQKARLAEIMRKQLIHDIPQPKATIKPKTRINTLSAYESSLVPSPPLKKISRLSSQAFDHPLVGGHGAMQLRGVVDKKSAGQARFQQLPGTKDLPVFPKDPQAAPIQARKFNTGSSFDNRDGPPVLLNDLLPVKATLVEELDPLGLKPEESKPNGW